MKCFKCLNCGVALGNTDGEVLQIANVLFRRTVTCECVNCGVIRCWKPVLQPKQAIFEACVVESKQTVGIVIQLE